ncbi:hypothetical protein B484DRAFT_390221 [Ochromonadaceae sp. CCMP2298]|nr:hypothetical protein B484DRAFT_390221 [Ochromonadaceae sp. CCMP2298]
MVSGEAIFVDNRFTTDMLGEGGGQGQGGEQGQGAQQWCSLWALLMTVQVMDLYLSLTVENDLLQVEEWDFFYWYWDYVCSTGVFTAEKLRNQRLALETEVAATLTHTNTHY